MPNETPKRDAKPRIPNAGTPSEGEEPAPDHQETVTERDGTRYVDGHEFRAGPWDADPRGLIFTDDRERPPGPEVKRSSDS